MGISSNPLNANQFFRNKQFHSDAKPLIACCGLQTPENLGSILRIAGNIGCTKVYLIDSPAEFRESKIKKTAGAAYGKVQWETLSKAQFLSSYPKDYQLIALETAPEATNIYQAEIPLKSLFILGNESDGIAEDILEQCHQQIYLPMPGPVKSMNITQALTACVFEWVRRYVRAS